ncbi:MAG: hypothetical protein IPL76_21295 [Gemmatimonadetes bacterium]|jgi:hypothetical protein|nr:hypothetical protein [Sulfuritalea sp.]MBK9069381.1 hypothetical protein [Gemmatimonadota bacterium]
MAYQMADAAAAAAAIAITSTGLTVFGIATGLHPQYLVAGAVGGLWWLSYQDTPQPLAKRFTANAISSVIAGFLTPLAVELVKIQEVVFSTQLARDLLPFPVAVGIGFLAYSRIGPAILRASYPFSKQSTSAPQPPPK